MASRSKRSRSDMQNYTPQDHKSLATSYAACWDHSSNHDLDPSHCLDPSRSFDSRQTAQEIPSCTFQQSTPFSGPSALSPGSSGTPDELFTKNESPYESILMSQDFNASSLNENGRRTRPEDYPIQPWQYSFMAVDQNWKQNINYSGHQQYSGGLYQHSSHSMQSGSYLTSSENTPLPQQYNSNYIPPSYPYDNCMSSTASPGSSPYSPSMIAVPRPRIKVDKAQDDAICSQMGDESSVYQDCLGTNISSASRRGTSMGLNAQRSSSRTPRPSHRTRHDTMDVSDFEESADGRLRVPRTPRRRQKEDDSQPRRRHLTPEGREHAKDVRRAQACKDCRRRKIKCKHVLERDLVSNRSPPGLQRDAFTFPSSFSSTQSSRHPSPADGEYPLFQPAMGGSPYCQSPTTLPRAYTEPTYTDYYGPYQ